MSDHGLRWEPSERPRWTVGPYAWESEEDEREREAARWLRDFEAAEAADVETPAVFVDEYEQEEDAWLGEGYFDREQETHGYDR